jgi:hypothetical protein
MAYADVQDIVHNPELIRAVMTQNWVLKSRFIQSGIFVTESLPLEGLQSTNIMEKRWQGESGQAIKAGQPISSINRTQVTAKWPHLWRYGSVTEPKLAEQVEKKGVDFVRASIAQDASNAAIQWIDDSAVKVVEAVGTILTSNAYDATSSTGTHADVNLTIYKLADNADMLIGGAIMFRSSMASRLSAEGLTTTALNPNIISAGTPVGVRQTILGMNPILTNKLALASDGDVLTYLIGRESVGLAYEGAPRIQISEDKDAFETYITKLESKFMIGVYGMTYSGAASEDVDDTDLATSSNWALRALDQSLVPICQLRTTV